MAEGRIYLTTSEKKQWGKFYKTKTVLDSRKLHLTVFVTLEGKKSLNFD